MRGIREDWNDSSGSSMSPQFGLPRLTPAVKALLWVNFGIFFGLFLIRFVATGISDAVYSAFALQPADFRSFLPPFWQVFSYGFLHDPGRISHILWNMLQLFFFGTMLEAILGTRRFAVTYVGALLAGALAQILADTATGGASFVIGASGAVLGVVVATAVLRPNTTVLLLFFPVLLKWVAIGIVVIDVFAMGSSYQSGVSDNVAHWVHLGGAAYGFVVARKGFIWNDPIQRFQAKQAIRHEEKRQREKQDVDQLLSKIHKQGIQSLSDRERETLKRASKRD